MNVSLALRHVEINNTIQMQNDTVISWYENLLPQLF